MSKRTLQDYLRAIAYIEDDLVDITPEDLGMVFEGLREKVDAYKGITDYMMAQANTLKSKAKEFADRGKTLENQAKNIKKHMAFLMSQNDTLELLGDQYTVKILKSESIDTTQDPNEDLSLKYPELIRQKISYEWNKDKLKKVLREQTLDFATIKNDTTVRFWVKK